MTSLPMQPFQPRPIRFLRVHEHRGWAIKLYSIALGRPVVDESALSEGLALALATLPTPARTRARPGVGFCVLHQGRGADYVVLAWWDQENELPVRIFVRTHAELAWRPGRATESFCVWDLQVMAFERDAYVATLLADPPLEPGTYLSRVLDAPVRSSQVAATLAG